MKIDNYDNSSTGYDCELSVFLDTDMARMDFKDMMHVHQHEGYYSTLVVEMHDGDYAERVTDLFEFSDDLTDRDYRRALFNLHMQPHPWLRTWTPSPRNFFEEYGVGNVDWKETFMEQLEEDYSIEEYAKEETIPLVEELPDDKVTDLYRAKISTGYSQGDYACVLIPNKHGWDGEHKEAIDKLVDNLLWDQPVCARLEITDQETGEDQEVYLEDFLEDRYSWDRDEIIDGLKKLGHPQPGEPTPIVRPLPQSVIDWVETNLPEYPEPV